MEHGVTSRVTVMTCFVHWRDSEDYGMLYLYFRPFSRNRHK